MKTLVLKLSVYLGSLTLFFCTALAAVTPLGEHGTVDVVGNTWTTVNLGSSYTNLVVVGSPRYQPVSGYLNAPFYRTVRVRNKTTNSFQIKVDNEEDSLGTEVTTVDWFATESGAQTLPTTTGLKMIAGTVNTSKISCRGNNAAYQNAETVTFSPTFNGNPVVLHTVSSENRTEWVFSHIHRGTDRRAEPNASTMSIQLNDAYGGCTHGNIAESIDYVAFDAGHGFLTGVEFDAVRSSDSIRCCGGNNANLGTAFTNTPTTFVVAQQSEDGGDGGWGVLHTGTAPTNSTVRLSSDEGGTGADRNHTTEIMGIFSMASTSVKTMTDINGMTFEPGDKVEFEMTIGRGEALGSAEYLDIIDSNLTLDIGSISFANCGTPTTTGTSATQLVVDDIDVSVAADCVITYEATLDDPENDGTEIINTSATVLTNGVSTQTTGSPAFLTVDATPILGVTKTDNDADDLVFENQTITYTITTSNTGNGDATVTLNDTISGPVGTPFNINTTNCGTPVNTSSGSTITLTGMTVTTTNDCMVTYQATVDAGATRTATISNSADISAATEGGLDPTAQTTSLTVDVVPEIYVTIIDSTTDESGDTATVQLSLSKPPSADVTIPLSVSDATEGNVAANIVIAAADWNTPANNEITITGVDDTLVDTTVAYSLVTGDPTSGDTEFDGLNDTDVADAALTNADNDTLDVTVDQSSTQTDPTNATPISFTVVFSSAISLPSFSCADLDLSASTATGVSCNSITEIAPSNGTTYRVNVTALTSGTVSASLGAGLVLTPEGGSNATSASTDNTITFDINPPSAPAATPDMTAGTDSGSSDTDNITNNTTPDFTGSCTNGETITLYIDGAASGNQICAGGVYTITANSVLGDGNHSVTATATDAAGNESNPSTALSITIDTINPTALNISVNTEAPQNIDTPIVTFSATDNESGIDHFEISEDAGAFITRTSPYTAALTPATGHSITLKAIDLAGNEDTANIQYPPNITITAPTILSNGTISDTTIAVSGPNNITSITDAGGISNSLSCDPMPAPGPINCTINITATGTLTINAQDSSGASGSNTQSYAIETVNPIITLVDSVEAGPVQSDAVTVTATDDSGLSELEYKLITNATCNAVNYGGGAGTSFNSGDTIFTENTEANNTNYVCVKATDNAGNTVYLGSAEDLNIDITPPTDPVLGPDMTPGTDTGAFNNDNITANQSPTFSQNCTNGDLISLFINGVLQSQENCIGSGFSLQPASSLADGVYNATYTATDSAGNESQPSPVLNFTIDTTKPTTPSAIPDLADASDTGTSNTDNVTNDTTPDFDIACTIGTTVTLYIDGSSSGTPTNCTTGSVTITAGSALTQGNYAITFTETDAAGNESDASNPLNITLDLTPPGTPSTPDMTASSDTGESSTDDNTSDTTPDFTGTCTNGETVILYVDGVAAGSQVCSGNSYTITPNPALTEGPHNITITTTDEVGNESVPSAPIAVTIDTMAPTTPVAIPDLTTASDTGSSTSDNITKDIAPDFTMACTNGNTVTLYVDGNASGTAVCSGGSATITASPTLGNGDYAVTFTETDSAGNQSLPSPNLDITIDIDAPVAPADPSMTAATDSGSSNSDNVTTNTSPDFTGSCTNGETITLYVNSILQGSTICAASTYTISTVSVLTDGNHTATTQVTDVAGNTSAVSGGLTFTVDNVDPVSLNIMVNIEAPFDLDNPEITFTANDVHSAISYYEVATDGGGTSVQTSPYAPNLTPAAIHTVTVTVYDLAGNSTSLTVEYPPSVSIIDSTTLSNSTITDTTIYIFGPSTITSVVDTGGISNNLNCGPLPAAPPVNCTINITGTGTLTVTAQDSTGAIGRNFQDYTIEGILPVITFTDDVELGPEMTDSVAVTATDDNGIATLAYQLQSSSTCSAASFPGVGTAFNSGDIIVSQIDETNNAQYICIKAIDNAGNTAFLSSANDLNIDITPPVTPTTTATMEAGTDSGAFNNDSITNNQNPSFTGTCSTEGELITLYIDGVLNNTGTCTGGVFSVTAGTLTEGTYNVTFTITDLAENESGMSPGQSFEIDLTPNSVPTVNSPNTGDEAEENFTVTAQCTAAGEIISVSNTNIVPNPTTQTCTAAGALEVPVTFNNNAIPGTQETISVTITDVAGNESNSTDIELFVSDGDGVPRSTENGHPNGGDGNGDGTPDGDQTETTSITNAENTNYNTLDITSATCTNTTGFVSQKEINLSSADLLADYPLGLWDFRLVCDAPGQTADIVIYLDRTYDTDDWIYKKYDRNGNVYAIITNQITFGVANVGGNDVTTITYSVTDGGPLDEDGVANGVIIDPSGPAIIVNGAPSSGSGGNFVYPVGVCDYQKKQCRERYPTQASSVGSTYDAFRTCVKSGASSGYECSNQWMLANDYQTCNSNTQCQTELLAESVEVIEAPETVNKTTLETNQPLVTDDAQAITQEPQALQCSTKAYQRFAERRGDGSFNTAFTDNPQSHPAYNSLIDLAEQGVISGDDGTLAARLEDEISRAETVKIFTIARQDTLDQGECQNASRFSDVASRAWYNEFVQNLEAKDIVHGYPDSLYRPNKTITKAEAYKVLALSLGYTTKQAADSNITESAYWYTPYAQAVVNSMSVPAIVNAYSMDHPMTRGDMFLLLSSALKELDGLK